MSRQRPAEESLLFDLPLDKPPGEPAPEEELAQTALPLTTDVGSEAVAAADPASMTPGPLPRSTAPAVKRATDDRALAKLWPRAAAGLTDLGVCTAVLVVLSVALLALGIRVQIADWPAGGLFLLTFSFLYTVLPLAFWGRTPGMALTGLRTSSKDGRPLTFRQAVLSWIGAVLTVTLAGLPLLLALGGRSLSDLTSGSVTRQPGRPR